IEDAVRPVSEQVRCERGAAERAGEENDDYAEAEKRDLVAAETDPDELPVTARLDRFGLHRCIDRESERIRCVDANAHERGDGISSHAKLPPIRTIRRLPPPEVSSRNAQTSREHAGLRGSRGLQPRPRARPSRAVSLAPRGSFPTACAGSRVPRPPRPARGAASSPPGS